MILAVTGHRPERLGGYDIPNPVFDAVVDKIEESLLILKPERVLLGMALGVDQWTAGICVLQKIPFDAVIPFAGQDAVWPEHARRTYRELLLQARQVHTLHPGPYSRQLLMARNRWMVEHADELLAVWDGKQGSGTSGCVNYALECTTRAPMMVYKLALPQHVWDAADRIYDRIQERRDIVRRPPPPPEGTMAPRRFVRPYTMHVDAPVTPVPNVFTRLREQEERKLRGRPPGQVKAPEPEEKPKTITFRRIVDVGDDDD